MAIKVNNLGVEKYTIQINEGGEIVLNPGLTGSVTINGDVDIAGSLTAGSSTVIEREDLVIFDNTIRINAGETGPGVSLSTAGLIIDRGTRDDAFLFFDETKNTLRNGSSVPGAFKLQDATANESFSTYSYLSLYTSGVLTSGDDLYLVGTGNGVVTVTGTADYENKIWDYAGDGATIPEDTSQSDRLRRAGTFDDDVLVNVRGMIDYVASYHLYNYQDKIQRWPVGGIGEDLDPTYVSVEDSDKGDGTGDLDNKVNIVVGGNQIATFYSSRFEVENLRFNNDTITSNDINGSVVIQGTGTGQVKLNDFVNLTIQDDTALTAPVSGVTLYSKTIGDGGTGLYFKNQDDTTDEIISRNKALLYSIIF